MIIWINNAVVEPNLFNFVTS